MLCPHCNKQHALDKPKGAVCPMTGKFITCPRCGYRISSKDRECLNCGEYLPEVVEVFQAVMLPPAKGKEQRQEQQTQEAISILEKPVSPKRIPVGFILGLAALFICTIIMGAAQLWQRLVTPDAGITEIVAIPSLSRLTATKISISSTPLPTDSPTETPVPAFTPMPTATVPSATPTIPVFAKITASNVERLIPVLELNSPHGASDLAFSPDGRTLASSGLDGFLRIWDPYYGTLHMQLGENLRDLFTVAFNPDGQTIVAGGADFVLYSWDAYTGKEGTKYVGHSGWVNQVAFDPGTKTMVSSSTSIIFWNFETGKVSKTISRNVADFAFAPNGGLAVPDVIDTQVGNPPYRQLFHTPVIRVLDFNNGKTLYRYNLNVSDPDPGAITSVEFSPDGEKIAVGGPEDSLWFGNTRSSNLDRLLQSESNAEITDIAFSPDSQILAAAYTDATIRLWSTKSGKFLSTLKGHSEEVRSVIFSPDGKALVSSSDDDTIIIWRIK